MALKQSHQSSTSYKFIISHIGEKLFYGQVSVISTKLIWGSAQVDFMLGSELCSRKEHAHRIRMIEVRGLDILPNWEIL